MEKGKTVGIEGNVGSGKTTLCRRLAGSTGLSIVPEYMELIRKDISQKYIKRNSKEQFALFILLEQLRLLIFPYNVQRILDRTFLSIIGYVVAASLTITKEELRAIISENGIGDIAIPANLVFLSASCSVRLTRATRRGGRIHSIFFDSSFSERYEVFFKELSDRMNLIYVDTDELSADDIDIVVKEFMAKSDGSFISLKSLFD